MPLPRINIERLAETVVDIREDEDLRECLAVLIERKFAHTLEVAYLTRKSPGLTTEKLEALVDLGFLSKKLPSKPRDTTDAYYYSNGLAYKYELALRKLLAKNLEKVRARLREVNAEKQPA